MHNLKKIIAYIFLGICSFGLLVTGVTFAWLATATTYLDFNPDGNVLVNYFYDGDGSENTPFRINDPVHFNNLTELYARHPTFYQEDYHFKLMNNIDMSDYPSYRPIGSESKPFNGIFDGDEYIVENINVVSYGESDIGIFGYVGEDAEIKDVYFDNVNIDVSNAADTTGNDHNSNAYVGYIAGHIDDARCFSNTYVNNCSIDKGSCNIHNDWGYFGYCKNADSIDAFINKASGQGQGNEWGGSIDMHSLNNRLYNHLNSTDAAYSSKGYYGKYDGTYTKISVYRGDKASTYYKRNPNTQQVFYNLMGNGNHTKNENYTLPGTYIPLLENADGTIPAKNTGYIVSDSEALNSANGTVRSASYQMRYIANSLVGTNASDANVYSGTGSAASVSYNTSNLEILTNKGTTYSNSNYYLIKDTHNQGHSVTNSAISSFTKSDATTPANLGFEKYDAARSVLDEILTGNSFIHGIHFMGSAISTSKTITATTAIINGETKSNYILPKSCIDFTLKEDGIINFFGGSYYARTSSSYADSFFTLNYITRNAQGGLSSIKQINNIYQNTNTAEGQPKYVYQFSDNTYSTGTRGTLLFNMNFIMNQPPAHNALYYFEIPANSGEYALGTVSGKTGGGYLMYLDIGASGSEQTSQLVDDFKSVEYRSTPDMAEHSILLLRYAITENQQLLVSVSYDTSDKKYSISASSTSTISIEIVMLNTDDYTFEFNGDPIVPADNAEIGSLVVHT